MAIAEKTYEVNKIKITTKDNQDINIICTKIKQHEHFLYCYGVIEWNGAAYKLDDVTKFLISIADIKTMFVKTEYKTHSELVEEYENA